MKPTPHAPARRARAKGPRYGIPVAADSPATCPDCLRAPLCTRHALRALEALQELRGNRLERKLRR